VYSVKSVSPTHSKSCTLATRSIPTPPRIFSSFGSQKDPRYILLKHYLVFAVSIFSTCRIAASLFLDEDFTSKNRSYPCRSPYCTMGSFEHSPYAGDEQLPQSTPPLRFAPTSLNSKIALNTHRGHKLLLQLSHR